MVGPAPAGLIPEVHLSFLVIPLDFAVGSRAQFLDAWNAGRRFLVAAGQRSGLVVARETAPGLGIAEIRAKVEDGPVTRYVLAAVDAKGVAR
jgi:hypothetical protein